MSDLVPLDFDPMVRQLRGLLLGVDDVDLPRPTPCPGWSVATLLDHLLGLSVAFTKTARKITDETTSSAPQPSAGDLSPQWRGRLPAVLDELAQAWKDPAAWTGTGEAGGVTLPGAVMGLVAMNELTMHGWDLARATGQEFAADPRTLAALIDFLAQGPDEGTPGVFGPKLPAGPDATPLEQALALAGRDPGWQYGRRDLSGRSTSAGE